MPKRTAKVSALADLPIGLPPLNVKPPRTAFGNEPKLGNAGLARRPQYRENANSVRQDEIHLPASLNLAGDPDDGSGVAFIDLKSRQCKYGLGPLMEPSEKYCGKPQQEGSPYCSNHHKRCYSSLTYERQNQPQRS